MKYTIRTKDYEYYGEVSTFKEAYDLLINTRLTFRNENIDKKVFVYAHDTIKVYPYQ